MEEEQKNINLILKQESGDDGKELSLSLLTVFRQLKRFVAWWIIIAFIGAIIITVTSAMSTKTTSRATALVSFGFSGIEKGLDPNGATFDVTMIKSTIVIDRAIAQLGLEPQLSDDVRNAMTIKGLIPEDAINRITVYQNLYSSDSSYSLNAAKEMLDVTYYPSQFKISLNNKKAGLSTSAGEQLLDTILDCYRDYFFETYGYNQALGSAVTASDYTEYDYSEAVDLFETSLNAMKKYVSDLAKNDTTRFRSVKTGYTFADMNEAISALIDVDLKWISSYVTMYNVTKDKESLVTYYQFQIDSLTRQKGVQQQTHDAIKDSLDNYEKDSVIIMPGTVSSEAASPTFTQGSTAYDDLHKQKIDAQTAIASYTERIGYYQRRMESLQSASASTAQQMKTAEESLVKLNDKVNAMLEKINSTADEYYENVTFANAFNILVPASSTSNKLTDILISDIKKPLFIAEGLIFILYMAVALIMAVRADYFNKHDLPIVGKAAKAEGSKDENPPAEENTATAKGTRKNNGRK